MKEDDMMLELKNISWTAPDGRVILKDVSFKIDDNKLVAITGPNGSGKTTLAKILMGIEKPTSGRIILNGRDITDLDVTERAKLSVSFAFQQPVRFKGITVKNLIETAANKQMRKDEACAILQMVGLCANDYLYRDVDATLSGGEIKRIEIASVLARNSVLSIFDEPEAGIDLWSFQNLIKTFENMRRNLSGTLIIISHQERILRIADEIVMIANGTVADQGPGPMIVEKILARERRNADSCKMRGVFDE